MRILIIEDEPKVAAYMRKGLVEQGFVVDAVNNGTAGLHEAMTNAYDLAVVDVTSPFLDGWTVVERMRGAEVVTPVLFVTARDAVEDRVRGLDSDTNVVDVAIRRLRAKIDVPFSKSLIHTIRGVGYVLEER